MRVVVVWAEEVSGREGQGKSEGTTLVRPGALGPNTAAVGLDQVFGNGQPNAAAAARPRARFIHPVEAGEDKRQVFGRDTDAGISHRDLCVMTPF